MGAYPRGHIRTVLTGAWSPDYRREADLAALAIKALQRRGAPKALSCAAPARSTLVEVLFMLTSVIPVPTAVPGTAYVHLQMSSRAYHAGTTALAPVLFAATRSAISVLRDRKFVAPVPRARSRRLAKARNLTDQPKAYPLAGSARTRRRFCRLHPARVRLIDVWRLRLCSLLVPPRPTALPLTDRGGGQ